MFCWMFALLWSRDGPSQTKLCRDKELERAGRSNTEFGSIPFRQTRSTALARPTSLLTCLSSIRAECLLLRCFDWRKKKSARKMGAVWKDEHDRLSGTKVSMRSRITVSKSGRDMAVHVVSLHKCWSWEVRIDCSPLSGSATLINNRGRRVPATKQQW